MKQLSLRDVTHLKLRSLSGGGPYRPLQFQGLLWQWLRTGRAPVLVPELCSLGDIVLSPLYCSEETVQLLGKPGRKPNLVSFVFRMKGLA